MGRAAGNRDHWWGSERNYSAAQVSDQFREEEEYIPFEPTVLFSDDELMVVDKPAFLPATPNGRIVANTVQQRIRDELQEPNIVALHRLDLATSGVLLLSRNPHTRGRYQRLFQEGGVRKTYECLTVVADNWTVGETRNVELLLLNEPGKRGVRVVSADDPRAREAKLALTEITYLGPVPADLSDVFAATSGGLLGGGSHGATCSCGACGSIMQVGRWRLCPSTGRTHQLRVTMDHIGYTILGEDTYGTTPARDASKKYSPKLRLLATEVTFDDPIIAGLKRHFTSQQHLY